MLATAYFDWLYNALGSVLAFFYALVPSYAFAIAMVTISVRVILIPLTAKQVKSQRAMQLLQPELKKLQAKYKGDRQQLNEEMMKLYKEHKANPLAGCLPLILQMPLFIVLYRLIRSLSEVPPKHIPGGSSVYHALVASGGKLESFGINLADKPQSVLGLFLVAAVVGTGYFQQKQMTGRMPKDSINPQMQMVTKVFPVMFGFISLSVPAGVVLYFLVSNLWQIGQQKVAFRNQTVPGAGAEKEKASGTADGPAAIGKGGPTKGGGQKGGGAPKAAAGTPKPGVQKSGSPKAGPQKAGPQKAAPQKAGSQKAGSQKAGAQQKAGPQQAGPQQKAGPQKAGPQQKAGTPKGGGPRSQGGGGGGGGTSRPPSGRVTPKGGPKANGRVTPKGGPGGANNSGVGQKGNKAGSSSRASEPAAAPSSGGSLRSRLSSMNRAAKAKRPPPAARPKGLPPTKGSSGGSSRKES
jgi:YidC/Oxa1 family membrane protein insertase